MELILKPNVLSVETSSVYLTKICAMKDIFGDYILEGAKVIEVNRRRKAAGDVDHPLVEIVCLILDDSSYPWRLSPTPKELKLLHVQVYLSYSSFWRKH